MGLWGVVSHQIDLQLGIKAFSRGTGKFHRWLDPVPIKNEAD
jgi:hypothetical protein